MTVRELARSIGRDASPTFVAVEKYIRAGILLKSERPGHRKRVSLNRAYPAYVELRDLLREMGRQFGYIVAPQKAIGCGSKPATVMERREIDLHALFGSVNRAMLLLLIEERDDVDREDVARLMGVHIGSAQLAIEYLLRENIILLHRREGLRRPIVFNEKHPLVAPLRRLLRRISRLDHQFGRIAKYSRREVGGPLGPKPRPVPRPRRNGFQNAAARMPFFDVGQSRVVFALAMSPTPLRAADIASTFHASTSTVRGSVGSLRRCGIVETVVAPTEGGTDLWVALRSHPMVSALKALAARLGTCFGLEGVTRRRNHLPPATAFRGLAPIAIERAGRRHRFHALRAIVMSPEIDVDSLATALHTKRRNALAQITSMMTLGVIETRMHEGRLRAFLSPRYPAATELRRVFGLFLRDG